MERDLDSTGMNLRRLAHEVAETRRRMVIGGSFYVLGWVLVCLFTPVVRTYPWASAALALVVIGLAVARVVIRPPAEGGAAVLTRWLDLQWIIIQASAATWGGVVFWTLIDPVLTDARVALLIGAAGALAWAQIGRIVYGATDEKRGFMTVGGKQLLHPKTRLEMGVMEEECGALMTNFFKEKR